MGVMDHLRRWELERCFAELRRVLAPGGAVLVHTCANRLYFKNWTYGLRRAAARALWEAEVEPRPNYKLLVTELYGEPLPEGFPMRPAPRWRARLALGLLRTPVAAFLAREFFVLARPPR